MAHHPDPHVSWRRRTVRGDGVDLAVHETGAPDAPVAVLVHGYPDTHRMWLPVAERLASRLRVVLYDTRGQGLSPTDAPDAAFTLPHLAADLMAVVDDASPDGPAHVVGHDWGSVQAWEAVCEPGGADRIASFTSISGPNLDHVAAWTRRTLRRPSPAAVARLAAQGLASSYVPFLVSPLAPRCSGCWAGATWSRGCATTAATSPCPAGRASVVRACRCCSWP
ncbi:alpha/beta fold hydrolase [Nocardioides sp. T5]|uniref:alpha/beta fold hydrolase n=1 Tax=Nocardioides sp. T5 TaxID=3400182 RepID=UPI003A863B1B